jgi:hypothetical protein
MEMSLATENLLTKSIMKREEDSQLKQLKSLEIQVLSLEQYSKTPNSRMSCNFKRESLLNSE